MAILNNIEDTFNTLNSIGDVSSTKMKQEILSQHSDNEVLKTLLFSAYSPFVQYNIKKIPTEVEDCEGIQISEETYEDFFSF